MDTTTLHIEGMSCAHCVRAVTEALVALPSVRDARVDLAAGTAEVDHEGVDRARLVDAVEEAGYRVEG